MATVSITIPDAVATRVLDAFAKIGNWSATLPGGVPNPVTKAQNAKNMLIEHMKQIVKAAEAPGAAETARQSVITNVDSTITLT